MFWKQKINFDPYTTFFILLIGHFIALMLGMMLIVILKDQVPLGFLPLISLSVITIMMNQGDQNPSAKEVFWGWIILTTVFGLLALYGQFLIGVMKCTNC